MAKKTKKIKAAKRRAMPALPRPAEPPAASNPPLGRPVPPAEASRRGPARGPVAQGSGIPLDRVPYFRSDLKRIAITVGIMFALIVAGSIALPNLLTSVFR